MTRRHPGEPQAMKDHGGRAVLIDHDDEERAFAYQGTAATYQDTEPIAAVAERLGWLTVSMKRDWASISATRRA